jgi:transcriptional regulator with XRE-family HTH domain
MQGYGDMIRRARDAKGLTEAQLAARLGKSRQVVLRLEAEEQVPDRDYVNALVSILPLSADDLLRACGYHLNPESAARLPNQLVEILLEMDPHRWQSLIDVLPHSRGR